MSHFIANTISFSRDFKQFKLKGGDNNVTPRSNYWTTFIPIEELYNNVQGGMVKLNSNTEKLCLVKHLVSKLDFGGSFNEETDYYHVHRGSKNKNLVNKIKKFDNEFLDELTKELHFLSNKKTHVLCFTGTGNYIKSYTTRGCYNTHLRENAKKISKWKAYNLATHYKKCEVIEL